MKKTFIAFTLASLFMASAVQAKDYSAVVDISGSVVGDHTECAIFAESSVTLAGKIETLPAQGANATKPSQLGYSIQPINGNSSCVGKVELQLHGNSDDSDGNTLKNDDATDAGAKGVGIGLFDANFKPINIKDNHITITDQPSFINLQMVKLTDQTPVEGNVHGSLTLEAVHL